MSGDMDEMREIINDFVTETNELIEIIDNDLLELERSPDDLELVNKLFRAVHTIKGAAGFLGFNKIVDVVHSAENVLNKCRQGELEVTSHIGDSIFKAVDLIKGYMENIEANEELEADPAEVIQELHECLEEGGITPEPAHQSLPEPELEPEPEPESSGGGEAFSIEDIQRELAAKEAVPAGPELKDLSDMVPTTGALKVLEERMSKDALLVKLGLRVSAPAEKAASAPAPAPKEEAKKPEPKAPVEEKTPAKPAAQEAKPAPAPTPARKDGKPDAPAPPAAGREKKGDQTIRVDIERLDHVMNLVGELVLGRNRVLQIGHELEQEYENDIRVQNLMDTMAQVNMITTDLQLAVMKTRMQPVKKVFNRFPRMVRDLAKSLGKEVELELEGEDTELDKSVIEEIGDPLVHLVRNSVDHGMEMPDERKAAGKPHKGKVVLSAYHEGNNIIIEVRDDGKGIDPEKIADKALEKGIVSEAELERMTERDKLNLVFAPGFSTAEKTTDISGRGVGMDVVRNNVVKLNGTINTHTELGKGTTFSVKLPLTVAIIQTLMVQVADEAFALPLVSVVETVRTSSGAIQFVEQQEVIHLREEVLQLVRLSDIFDIEPGQAEISDTGEEWLYVVVIAIAEKKVGLVVEKLLGQEEVVIKSMGKFIQPKGIAGATILGNGRVTLIVDLGSLMEIIESGDFTRTAPGQKPRKQLHKKGSRGSILLVDDSKMARMKQKKILETGGYEVVEAENGRQALQALQENPGIQLVLTDIIMPGMDGIEMTRQIKADKKFSALPVLALSVVDEKEDQEKGLQAGIAEFLYKTDMQGMLSSIRRYVS